MLTPVEVETISRNVIRERPEPLDLIGIAESRDGRVEILLRVRNREEDSARRLLLNLPREDRADLEAQLRQQLQEALAV